MYFDTSILRSHHAILFLWLLPRLGLQVHFNTMCFSFATKMMADTKEFLRAGNEDSAKRLIQNLNPSSVVDVRKVDFIKLSAAKRRWGKQVENKERHFEEVAKGKYDLCLFHNENDGLKTFYTSLHLKWLWRKPSPLDQRHITWEQP